ncbi:MAG: SOS response-associated peptidase, partial [Ectothiorhodospiraceae bacterium]|nr:SOS response-associated peptidase [Ectothiorhodospiraceae bacterium]
MCGRYDRHSPKDRIADAIGIAGNVGGSTPNYNVAPATYPLNVNARFGRDAPHIEQFRWGFRPHWAKEDAPSPINARSEKVATSPYFRQAFAHRRCLVPADGWFEWQKTESGKVPQYIYNADGELLFFAGIYEIGEGAGEPSFAILTQPAAKHLAHIHDRMPV